MGNGLGMRKLGAGQKPTHSLLICGVERNLVIVETARGVGFFAPQVTGTTLGAQESSRTCDGEPALRSLMSLKFWHREPLSLLLRLYYCLGWD